jgi:hypothetical protein
MIHPIMTTLKLSWPVISGEANSSFLNIVSSVRSPIQHSTLTNLRNQSAWGQTDTGGIAENELRSPNAMRSQSRRPLSFHIRSRVTPHGRGSIFLSLGYVEAEYFTPRLLSVSPIVYVVRTRWTGQASDPDGTFCLCCFR